MSAPSVSHFLETVERSGLVDRARLAEVLTALERETGPDALRDTQVVSSHLTHRGLLTGWQSERLLEGRHRGFFLGKYKLLDHLGTGGMSSVYEAEHTVMRRRVAIKVLPIGVGDPSRLRRFHREARAVALLDHPNIVRAYDIDQDGDVHFLVMEYVRGRDLKVHIEQEGPLAPRTAAEYVRQAAEGLAYTHRLGLVHRDIKPANLLVDQRGIVKVLDLGLASVRGDIDCAITKEFDDKVLGTVDYLAPEQAIDSHQVDGRADTYSLGCTLYYLLSGRPPFTDSSLAQRIMAHQVREPVDIREARPEVPESLVQICRRMMAKSPSARYQHMEEVSEALTYWLRLPAPATASLARSNENLRLAPVEDEPPAKALTDRSKLGRGSVQSSTPQSRAKLGEKPSSSPDSKATSPEQRCKSGPRLTTPGSAAIEPVNRSRFDELLAELSQFETQSHAGSGVNLGSPIGKPLGQPNVRSRWDSPWFAIAIGSILGLMIVLAWFAYHFVAG